MGAILSGTKVSLSPDYLVPPRRTISFRVLREGQETVAQKEIRVFSDGRSVNPLAYFFTRDGVNTLTQTFSADAIDGTRMVLGLDDEAPPKLRATSFDIGVDGPQVFDISTGSGSVPTQPASAQARVRLNGLPASRTVIAIERPADGQWRVSGYGDSLDGFVDLKLQVATQSGYLISLDDFGTSFVSGAQVAVGHRVRPSLYAGWLYQITEAGTLPTVEPSWWAAEGGNSSRPIGTARAIAVRYFQPIAHGPVPVEVI